MKFTMFPRNNSNRICSRALYSAAQIGGGGEGGNLPRAGGRPVNFTGVCREKFFLTIFF
jgi:hypothetical protein